VTTPKLALPELSPAQASKELTHNQALAILDQLAMPRVVDKDLTAPPGSPANGALYIVATGGTGAWAGKDGYLAWWLTSVAAWTFLAPSLGMSVRVMDELDSSNIPKIYGRTASSWVEQSGMTNPMTTAGDLTYGGSAGVPARLPIGSTSQVMTVAGGVPTWADPSGAALTNFTEAKSVAAPNATIPAVSLTATSSEANVDLSLRPKGTGALLAAVPDNTATGGNKRGARAVDLQTGRSNAAKVASGDNSVIGGGLDNLASAMRSTVGGGNGNSASGGNDGVFCGNGNSTSGGQAVVAGGSVNSVAGPYGAIVGGGSNAIGSGSYCFIGGGVSNACAGAGDYRSHLGGSANTASAAYASTTGGRSNVADGLYSVSLGGYQASAKGVTGAVVHASGQFYAVGDAQAGSYTLRIATTNATPAVLTADASATPVAANSLTLGSQNAYVIRGRVIARNTANGECWAWEVTAIARRTNTAATTALVGSPTVTSLGGDASLSAASIAVTANTTLGSVVITVTGIAATGIHWLAVVDTVEVG